MADVKIANLSENLTPKDTDIFIIEEPTVQTQKVTFKAVKDNILEDSIEVLTGSKVSSSKSEDALVKISAFTGLPASGVLSLVTDNNLITFANNSYTQSGATIDALANHIKINGLFSFSREYSCGNIPVKSYKASLNVISGTGSSLKVDLIALNDATSLFVNIGTLTLDTPEITINYTSDYSWFKFSVIDGSTDAITYTDFTFVVALNEITDSYTREVKQLTVGQFEEYYLMSSYPGRTNVMFFDTTMPGFTADFKKGWWSEIVRTSGGVQEAGAGMYYDTWEQATQEIDDGVTIPSDAEYLGGYPASAYLADIAELYNITDNIQTITNNWLNLNHPVGSYYQSDVVTSPAVLFGGTWTQIKDRFLVGAGNLYAVNATGGEVSHVLTKSELPVDTLVDNGPGAHYTTPTLVAGGSWANSLAQAGITGSQAHNNLPPYQAAYMWKRTA